MNQDSPEAIEIPADRLSPEALHGLIEEFINRDGTDYGSHEVSLSEKLAQVRRQLDRGTVVILFDPETATTTLINKV